MLNKVKSFFSRKIPIFFIDSSEKFEKAIDELSFQEVIGIDTEFDWRNTYYPNLSLLQISTINKIFLIDCIKLNSISKLKNTFEDKEILKIFHAVRSDVTVLSCSSNLKLVNCYDIQIAENFISNDGINSYAKIVLKYLNIKINKSETNSNWLKRPFKQSQISYAANDVRYLIKIYRKQKKILEKKNAYSTVTDLTKREVNLGAQKLYLPRLKKFKSQKKIEKDLFMWRENTAMERNVPPSYIFKDKYFKKILKVFDEDISKDIIYEILKNEKLANNLIESLK